MLQHALPVVTALVLLFWSGCKPVFVTASPRVVGQATTVPPDNGYLKVDVTSNLDAFSTPEYKEVAKGFKYLSVAVTVTNGAGAATSLAGVHGSEYPLLLLDLDTRSLVTTTGVRVSRGDFVNFDSSITPVLTFTVRAIPNTVATAYADTFQTLQRVSSGVPLSQLAAGNVYLDLAGRLLGNLANEANRSNSHAITTAVIGISGGSPNSSPFPLDGTPTVIFLRRSDSPPPLPESTSLRLCSNNPSTLCIRGESEGLTYTALPYLIIRASTTDYRPTTDWADTGWTCHLARTADAIASMERRLRATRFTEQQERFEDRMLGRAKVLTRAYSMQDSFDLEQPANVGVFANILNAWRFVGDGKGSYWERRYGDTSNALAQCFESEMQRRSPQHQTAFVILRRAFKAAQDYRTVEKFSSPITDAERDQLEGWLKQITEPVRFLRLKDGETYGALRAEQDSIERLILERDSQLAAKYVSASVSERATVRLQLEARLLSPCDPCRSALTEAIAKVNFAEANVAQQQVLLAQQEAERARTELVEARQRASQLADLASQLSADAAELSTLKARLTSSEQHVGERALDRVLLRNATRNLEQTTDLVRQQMMGSGVK